MAKIDVKRDVTSRLGLQPIKDPNGGWKFNGLVPARLVKIHLLTQDYKKGELEGKTVKALGFEFENYKYTKDEPDRYLSHNERYIGTIQYDESKAPTQRDEADIEKNILDMWSRIKHILDQCKNSGNFRDIADIPQDHLDKYFDLPTVGETEERVKAFENFFEYIVKFANGNGDTTKPIYLTEKGEGCPMWLKLLPNYPDGKWYSLPNFVNKGIVEAAVALNNGQLAPAKILQINPSETLELNRRNVQQSVGSEGEPGGADPGGIDPAVMNVLKGQ